MKFLAWLLGVAFGLFIALGWCNIAHADCNWGFDECYEGRSTMSGGGGGSAGSHIPPPDPRPTKVDPPPIKNQPITCIDTGTGDTPPGCDDKQDQKAINAICRSSIGFVACGGPTGSVGQYEAVEGGGHPFGTN